VTPSASAPCRCRRYRIITADTSPNGERVPAIDIAQPDPRVPCELQVCALACYQSPSRALACCNGQLLDSQLSWLSCDCSLERAFDGPVRLRRCFVSAGRRTALQRSGPVSRRVNILGASRLRAMVLSEPAGRIGGEIGLASARGALPGSGTRCDPRVARLERE
jgi:hypothetical protein